MDKMRKKNWTERGFAVILCLALVLGSGMGISLQSSGATAGISHQSSEAATGTGAQPGRSESETKLDGRLHAKAAVLLDMDSGRVLYEKNGSEILPMASTTKIMTCIVALEEGNQEDIVTASAYAAGQPKVHLGMQKGMKYQMKDLLYSLMLESHNDSAVAIAEHIGSRELGLPAEEERTREESQEAVKVFCDKMTKKARELGCQDTCFLTPNGLDAEVEDEKGEIRKHSTTAPELARIMRYCITQSAKKEDFLEITKEPSYAFADTEGKCNYSCINHNALLTMLEGAVSGKTGFTSQAGFCYVGALDRDGKQFVLALLACGWPGHKSWKWEDCRALFSYGLENYEYHEFSPEVRISPVYVENGASESGNPWEEVRLMPQKEKEDVELRLLTKEGESVNAFVTMKEQIEAPVTFGTEIGTVTYRLSDGDGREWKLGCEKLYINRKILKKDFSFVFCYIWKNFLL